MYIIFEVRKRETKGLLILFLLLVFTQIYGARANAALPAQYCKLSWNEDFSQGSAPEFKLEAEKKISITPQVQVFIERKKKDDAIIWTIDQHFGEKKRDLLTYKIKCDPSLNCSGSRVMKVKKTHFTSFQELQ